MAMVDASILAVVMSEVARGTSSDVARVEETFNPPDRR
jgi:hypothetical protein